MKNILHGFAAFIAFGIPLVLMGMGPSIEGLTVGAILTGLYHWAVSYLTT